MACSKRAFAFREFSRSAGIAGPCVPGALEGGEDCAAAGVPPAVAWPHAGITGQTITMAGIARSKIGRSCFIQVEGVSICKENCSVSRGIPARSREYPQFLGCTNQPAGGASDVIFVGFIGGMRWRALARQNRAPIHVEDFSRDKAGEFGAQEQHRSSNLLGPAGAAQ